MHIEADHELFEIANKTITFLRGFYSDFALELLSSMDYLVSEQNTFDKKIISQRLEGWSNRKKSMVSNPRYFDISLNHLQHAAFSLQKNS
jgi:hypothetical protein